MRKYIVRFYIFLIAVLFTYSVIPVEAAFYPILYVRSNGIASWPCGTSPSQPCKTISTAVAHANDYGTTTIRVAQGSYPEYVAVNYSLPTDTSLQLTIEGGWNSNFTYQTQDPFLTQLTPESLDDTPIISIDGHAWQSINMRLKNLKFLGVVNGNRRGIQVSSTQGTVTFAIEDCFIGSFRGNGIFVSALSIATVDVTIDNTVISGNHQYPEDNRFDGGAISFLSDDNALMEVKITDTRIINNVAEVGGGIHFEANNGGTLAAFLKNNIFAENQAEVTGGAISGSAYNASIFEITLTNNTIVDNGARVSYGDGISLFGGNNSAIEAYIKNSIFSNIGTDMYLAEATSGEITVNTSYSLYQNLKNRDNASTHNESNNLTNLDPLLNTDYNQTAVSPGIDKGICGIFTFSGYRRIAPYRDINGDLRPGFWVPLGCDIGADEYTPFPWVLFNHLLKKKTY